MCLWSLDGQKQRHSVYKLRVQMGLEESGAESVRASESFSGSLVSGKVGTELRGQSGAQSGARCVAGRQSSAQMPLGADSYLPDVRNSAIALPWTFLCPASCLLDKEKGLGGRWGN